MRLFQVDKATIQVVEWRLKVIFCLFNKIACWLISGKSVLMRVGWVWETQYDYLLFDSGKLNSTACRLSS